MGSAASLPAQQVLETKQEFPFNENNAKCVLSKIDSDCPFESKEQVENKLRSLGKDLLVQLLAGNHIEASELKSEDDLVAVVKIVLSLDFWRFNAQLHPNHGRVKNWLWVHSRYRNQMNDLLRIASGSFETGKTKFEAFQKKINSHSDFEDNQLFKFFCDEKLDVEGFQELKKQHEDDEVIQAVRNAADSESLVKALEEYVSSMKNHLELEERTTVHLWLNLSNLQYARFRSYLSWAYSMMY